jgi:hypothetical protein
VHNVAPLVHLSIGEQLELHHLALDAHEFADLPERYRALILEVEANLERLIAEQQADPKVAAGAGPATRTRSTEIQEGEG